jgi:hypothetical protein
VWRIYWVWQFLRGPIAQVELSKGLLIMPLSDVKFSGHAKRTLGKASEIIKELPASMLDSLTAKQLLMEIDNMIALPPIFMRTVDVEGLERSPDHQPGTPEDWAKLEEDICANGIRTPLALILIEGSLRLVDGIQRLQIAKERNIGFVPVKIFADFPGRGRLDIVDAAK